MHDSNQRTIFNDVNRSNSLKDLKQQLRWILRAPNQMVELETDEGKGEGESSRRRLGSSRTTRGPAPRLVATGATGQLEVPLEDPVDRPAKKLKHVGKQGKVVCIATGPCVVFPR